MKEFEIFRTGSWTSDKGISKQYTEADLDKIIENYNSGDPAPIVIGHPQTNAPAFGWIEKIKRVADRLIAVPKQLNDQFVDLVKNGAFKKRSISITPDLKLVHVGFLGAAAPAVEGLKEIQFNAEDDLLSFSDEYIPDDEDDEIDEQKNTSLKIKLDPAPDLKNFQASIESLNTIVSELKNNFSRLSDDELSKIHSRISELNFAMQVNDFELRLNEKLAYGSLTPAMKIKIMDIVSFLQKQNFSNSDFSFEQYIAQIKNLLLEFTESIPKIIYYENFADKPSEVKISADEFEDYNLDDDSLQIHKKALQYMKLNEGVSYVEAINQIAIS
jgi:hypothetical protein